MHLISFSGGEKVENFCASWTNQLYYFTAALRLISVTQSLLTAAASYKLAMESMSFTSNNNGQQSQGTPPPALHRLRTSSHIFYTISFNYLNILFILVEKFFFLVEPYHSVPLPKGD